MDHQRIHNGPLTTANGPRSAPAWFRYGVIAVAAILMCSCRAAEKQPRYRVAQDQSRQQSQVPAAGMLADQQYYDPAEATDDAEMVVADDFERALPPSPPASTPRKNNVQLAAAEIPLYLTGAQVKQAQCLSEGNWQSTCQGGACGCCASHDPVRGPSDEYLCDGGDFNLPAGVNEDWKVTGLEQEDTIAHYDTIDGRTIVTPSNKVCLYAPRFVAVRQVTDLRAYARIDAPGGTIQKIEPNKIEETEDVLTSLAEVKPNLQREKSPPSLLRERAQAGELDRDRRVALTISSLQPYCNVQLIRTGEVIGTDIVKIARASLAAITWTGDQAAQVVLDSRQAQASISDVTPGTIYQLFEPNNPKLRLVKLASKSSAQPGEEVEFTLRFDNIGDKVIGNVVITDNLTTRLEYVEGSQKSSLPANFVTQQNEGESLILRWELTEPLEKGKGGVIQFRCKVR